MTKRQLQAELNRLRDLQATPGELRRRTNGRAPGRCVYCGRWTQHIRFNVAVCWSHSDLPASDSFYSEAA